MNDVIEVIKSNLFGFDKIIFIAALINTAVYCAAKIYTDKLHRKLHKAVYVPYRRKDPEAVAEELKRIDEEDVADLRTNSEHWYAIFMNITAIFPLLGILGTVVSLLPMVSDMTNMQTNFFSALTSTFWGLVFAIIFKLLDGFLSSRIEDNDKSVNLFMERRIYAAETAGPGRKKEK